VRRQGPVGSARRSSGDNVSMLVELVGLEGGGKATVLRELVTELTRRNHPAVAETIRSPAIGHRRATLSNVPLAAAYYRESAPVSRRDRTELSGVVRRSAVLARLQPLGWTFVDEGPRHRLFALVANGVVEDGSQMLRRLHKPDLIVSVRCEPPLAAQRLRTKHANHWSHQMDPGPLMARLERYASAEARLLAGQSVPVLTCQNDEGAASDVAARLASMLLQRRERHAS
jgi:hypothetical protein